MNTHLTSVFIAALVFFYLIYSQDYTPAAYFVVVITIILYKRLLAQECKILRKTLMEHDEL